MLTLLHAAKGGSGTTVTAAAAALAHRGTTLLIDLDGDLPAVLGLPEPERPGVVDWLVSDAPDEHLADLVVDIDDSTTLLPARHAVEPSSSRPRSHDASDELATERWIRLAIWSRSWATRHGGRVVIDAGTQMLPAEFTAACDDRWLVTRACYLSLRRASRLDVESTGVVLVAEPGRSLAAADVAVSARAPIVATLPFDPAVSRAVDAGLLLASRIPRSFNRELAKLMGPARPRVPAAA